MKEFNTHKRFVSGMGLDFEDVYRENPILGMSVGPVSDYNGTGTLGCFFKVELEEYGKTLFLATTCHHVLSSGTTTCSSYLPLADD